MKIFILLIIIITPTISQRYADSCIKLLDQNQAKDLQSFANETIYHNLFYKSEMNSFLTLGSAIIEDRQDLDVQAQSQQKWESKSMESVGEEKDQGDQWRQIAGEDFVGEVFEKSDRYQWICPANFYTSIKNDSFNMFEVRFDNLMHRIHETSHPLSHNYFVNIRLNSHLEVYAGYGDIVVHSVDLNGFNLTIFVPSSYFRKHLKAESIPDFQITNNYGPGAIKLESLYSFTFIPKPYKHRRNIIHGGNDKDITIEFKFDTYFPIRHPEFPEQPKYLPKSGEESTRKHQKQKNWTYNDILVICGLICFIFSLFFLVMPFFVAKNNDFHLLDYYDYYQEIDELQ